MPFIKIQNDFTHGELDPRGITRFDVSLYHKALKRARNVLIDPLGGARRRFGTKYVGTITASENQYLLREFDYADDTKYVLVFTNNNIAVYYDDAKVHDITTTYTGAEVSNLGITQSFNLMVITHPDHAPAQLVRGGSHTSWTLSNISFKNEPGYDYAKNYDGYTFSLSAVTVGTGKTLTSTTAVSLQPCMRPFQDTTESADLRIPGTYPRRWSTGPGHNQKYHPTGCCQRRLRRWSSCHRWHRCSSWPTACGSSRC